MTIGTAIFSCFVAACLTAIILAGYGELLAQMVGGGIALIAFTLFFLFKI